MEENYIVSARKYRPTTFSSVVGQKALTATLRNAIATNRLAHAYLFCGSRGVGKTSCARIFAKSINCEHPTPQGDPCNECHSCRAFNENRSLNILELDAASNNSVNDIRELVDQVQIPPTEGRYRVFIIDEVHMLSQAAFNAFLKTLEEPPSYVVFVLATTEKHKIIPTILSRCQIYDFARITIADMIDHLAYVAEQEGITAERAALNVIAQKADGAMRDALSIFDQVAASSGGNITYQSAIDNLNVLDERYYHRLVEAFAKGDVPSALLIYREIRDHGFDSHFFITGLADYLRNLMVARDPRTAALLDSTDEVRASMAAQGAALAPEFFYKAMSLCNEADLDYRQASSKTFLVELLLIRLCQQVCPSPGSESGNGEGRGLKPIQPLSAPSPAPPASPSSPTTTKSTAPSRSPQQPAPAPARPQSHVAPPPEAPSQPAGVVMPPKGPEIVMARAAAPSRPAGQGRPLMGRGHISFARVVSGAESAPAQDAAPRQLREEPFTHGQVLQQWDAYMTRDPKAHLLNNTLRMHKPALPEGASARVSGQREAASFVVRVVNSAQVDVLNQEKPRLLEAIRSAIGNDFFDFSITVDEAAVPSTAWSDRKVLDHLVERTPYIARFITDLKFTLS